MISNQPDEFTKIVSDHRCIAILKALHRQPNYSSNSEIIGEWLETLALGGTRASLLADLERLGTSDVIRTENCGEQGRIQLLILTEDGIDYLEGRSAIENLPRIRPDCPY